MKKNINIKNIMETQNKQKCTNCKVNRDTNDFIGKAGQPVKRCNKCRLKEEKRSKRPDIKNKKNEKQRVSKYYKKRRDKKRAENEELFLKNNAENAKIWRDKNKEHLSKWRTKNFVSRFYGIKQQAQKKNIIWNENLTDEICYKLMTSNCFYCNYLSQDTLNGIDRLDSQGNYELNNCKSCCKKCNFMKTSLDSNTFIKRCIYISDKTIDYSDLWINTHNVYYNTYKTRATKKQLEFSLTNQEFENIIKNNCFYCNKENTHLHCNGIDRKNNTIGYTIDNCVSCCGECNYMKGVLNETEFFTQCLNIYNTWKNIPLTEYPDVVENKKSLIKTKRINIENTPIKINTEIVPKKEYKHIIHIEEPVPERKYNNGTNLPENCPIKPDDIPKHCYYIPVSKTRSDGFCCSKYHPKHEKDWSTTRRKDISIEDKYKQLMAYINNEEFTFTLTTPKQFTDKQINCILKYKKANKTKKDLISIFNTRFPQIIITEQDIVNILEEKIKPHVPIPISDTQQKLKTKIQSYTNEELLQIFKLKTVKNTTTGEAYTIIKKQFPNIFTNRNVISQIWKGRLDDYISPELKDSDEFKNMRDIKTIRVKKTKFSDEQLEELKEMSSRLSLRQTAKQFIKKYKTSVSTTFISKLNIKQ